MASMHLRRALILAAGAALLLTACGDDDDAAIEATTTTEAEEEATTTTVAAEAGDDEVNPEFAEYCGLVAELDQQEEFASPEQLEAIRAAAPEEISAEIDTAVDIFLAAIEADGSAEAAFDDPALVEAFGPIEAFEAENCGAGDDDEATGEVNPEFAEYCALALEVDAQPSFPDEEQLNELLAAAPDEIRAEAEVVVAAFLEAYANDTPEAAFDDPVVVENLGAIEDFEEANCGIDHTDD